MPVRPRNFIYSLGILGNLSEEISQQQAQKIDIGTTTSAAEETKTIEAKIRFAAVLARTNTYKMITDPAHSTQTATVATTPVRQTTRHLVKHMTTDPEAKESARWCVYLRPKMFRRYSAEQRSTP
jgi:hypothetical protein